MAGFERLSEQIEDGSLELGQLVKKQHAEVRQADFAGPDAQTASHERGHRGAMVRRAIRSPPNDLAAVQFAGDRGHHRYFKRFRRFERRQDSRETGRQQ